MFEHFEHPRELFEYQLGAALTMEKDSLAMLRELEMAAQNDEVRSLFSHHQDETEQQIRNLERALELLGRDPDPSPSATTKGLMKEGSSMLTKTSEPLRDTVALSAALGTEHYEISAYESLIVSAEAMGETEVCSLLEQNLEQEKHTSEELTQAARRLATATSAG